MIFTVLLCVMLLLSSGVAVRAEEDGDESTMMALPVAMYSDDTGFGGGVAAFKTYNAERVRSSSIQGIVLYTTKKQVSTGINWDHYFAGGRDRIRMDINYRKFPTDFYGLGNETDNDDPATFTPETVESEFLYERRVLKNIRVKSKARFRKDVLISQEPSGYLSALGASWYKGRTDMYLGGALLYDSRDNIFAAHSGMLAQVTYEGSVYSDDGGAFNSLELDVRTFFEPVEGIVSATMAYLKTAGGDIPFYELPSIGGSDRLRGYESKRFRDKSKILFQQDVRFPIWGPVDGAVFAATGRVATDRADLFTGNYHTAGGGGFRYYLNRTERLLIRLDYAVGSDNKGTYITFSEAF